MLRNLLNTYLKANSHICVDLVVKRYAGHSKWANIRHTKGLKDAQRSLLFTKLGRQMRVALQEGGSADPSKNLKLEQIIEQAKRLNMPAASIQSVLKSAQTDKSKCKSYLLEINSKLSDGGGRHLFEEKGLIDTEVPKVTNKNLEEILEIAVDHAIESGAEDVQLLDDSTLQFTCSGSAYNSVQKNLEKLNYKITSASVEFVPQKLQPLADSDLEICSNLYEKLESNPEIVKLCDNIA